MTKVTLTTNNFSHVIRDILELSGWKFREVHIPTFTEFIMELTGESPWAIEKDPDAFKTDAEIHYKIEPEDIIQIVCIDILEPDFGVQIRLDYNGKSASIQSLDRIGIADLELWNAH